MSAAQLLERLAGVKRTAPGRWVARCPAHQDRLPSLSIRELDDGCVLLHDFGGCGAIDVLNAVGLEWAALFPEQLRYLERPASSSRIPACDLLEIISAETSVVAIVAADLLANKSITEADWQRLARAAARIGRARDHAYGR